MGTWTFSAEQPSCAGQSRPLGQCGKGRVKNAGTDRRPLPAGTSCTSRLAEKSSGSVYGVCPQTDPPQQTAYFQPLPSAETALAASGETISARQEPFSSTFAPSSLNISPG